jgi:hypothetical protein
MEQRTISKGIIGSRIRWDSAPVKITADDALRLSNSDGGRKLDEAKKATLEALAGGKMSAEQLDDVAEGEDISLATMRRARTDLRKAGKIAKAKTGFEGGWEWFLCEERHAKATKNATKNANSEN